MYNSSGRIDVLHVDDDPDFADLTATFLERADDRFVIETATGASEGLDRLADTAFDCIVSDYEMPGMDGIDFLEAVRESHPDLPFILYTGRGSEAVASDAVSAGVTDYLQKESGTGQYEVLANRILNYVDRYRARRERRRHLDAIETAQEGIGILDSDGRFRYVNQAYADLYGYDSEEMVGEHWELLYRDEDVDEIHEDILPEVAEEGYWHGTTTGLRADGSTFVEDHILSMTDRGELVCTVRDISDRRERKRRFEAVFNNTAAFVGLLDPDGTVLEVNDTALEFGGLDREDVVGKPIWDTYWVGSNAETEAAVREAVARAREGDVYRDEIRIRSADGETVVAFSVRPVTDEDGAVTALVPEAWDISDRKEQTRRFETLVANLPGIVYRCPNERGWPVEDVRGNVERLTGYAAVALESGEVSLGDLIHPDDRDRVWEAVQDTLATGETFTLTYRIVTKGGEVREVWERGRVLPGSPDAVEGFITDIVRRS
jgi:PAS domain S-box-containing protein